MSKPDPQDSVNLHGFGTRPLFRALHDSPQPVRVEVDGIQVMARAQDSVASLLLNTCGPETYRRSPVSGLPRAPLCMMDVCFECLVEVDGQSNQQGCLIRVATACAFGVRWQERSHERA